MTTRPSVVVVGGGIAGLAAAWELTGAQEGPSESTPRIELIEESEHLGGALTTLEFCDRVIDLGPDGFLARRPEALALAKELGLEDQLEAICAAGASIWLKGALEELPAGLVLGVPTDAKSLKAMKGLSWESPRGPMMIDPETRDVVELALVGVARPTRPQETEGHR